mgnify:CR=1 FL=1
MRIQGIALNGSPLAWSTVMKSMKYAVIMMLLPLMCACLCACGGDRQTDRSENVSGTLQMGCFYEEDMIVLSAPERFLYSGWEGGGFQSVCTDPTCNHLSDSCSARTFHKADRVNWCNLGLVYRDRLIILHSYVEHVDYRSQSADGAGNYDYSEVWHTDIYEADLDGRNRKYRSSFDGGIGSVNLNDSAVMEDGMLYFGGPVEARSTMEYDDGGTLLYHELIYSDAFYGVNLEDYSVRRFAENKEKDGMSYSYYVSIYDGYVYAAASECYLECGNWYRIDPGTGECEEIMRFDSDVPLFFGAVGNQVYYRRNNDLTLYTMDVKTKEERAVFKLEKELAFLEAAVFDDRIWVLTDYCMEAGSYMTEYTVLNAEGEVVDSCHFDEYILFYGLVGDRLIYSSVFPEEKMGWVDLSDVRNLIGRGILIGYADGRHNDPILYNTN